MCTFLTDWPPMKIFIIIPVFFCFCACQTEQQEKIETENTIAEKKEQKKIERVIDDNNLSEKLGFPKEFFKLENTRDFGSFHNERLTIYLTEDAELNGFKSNDVALFFLHDKLVRIRYGLEHDIMEKLVDSLQLTPQNRNTLKKITMKLADRTISYKRTIDSTENRKHFYLYEELPEYKKMLWTADLFEFKTKHPASPPY